MRSCLNPERQELQCLAERLETDLATSSWTEQSFDPLVARSRESKRWYNFCVGSRKSHK